MAIIGNLPNNLANGTDADASQVMANLNFIINQVNANVAPLGTLDAPSGTRTIFNQSAAPVGWVQDTTVTDHTLQVVGTSSAGQIYSSGNAYTTMFFAQWSTDSHALVAAEIPSHTHQVGVFNQGGSQFGPAVAQPGNLDTTVSTDGGSGGGQGHSHTKTFNVNYARVMIAQKS